MDWLNYHHLFYFWSVVRAGSIAAACRRLLLSPATISAQLSALQDALGAKLFRSVGRRLAPTEFGQLAARYADEVFGLGQEFLDVTRGRTRETPPRFRLGVDDVLPKRVVVRVLEAAFRLPQAIRLVCVEGTQPQLLPHLAAHDLDLVLSDAPADPAIKVRTFSRLLDESGPTVCAGPALARGRLYAISVERRVKHPAAVALVDNAGTVLRRRRASRRPAQSIHSQHS